jgi:hypothetical protein
VLDFLKDGCKLATLQKGQYWVSRRNWFEILEFLDATNQKKREQASRARLEWQNHLENHVENKQFRSVSLGSDEEHL